MSAKPWPEVLAQTQDELKATEEANKDAKEQLQSIENSLTTSLKAHEAADQQVDTYLKALDAAGRCGASPCRLAEAAHRRPAGDRVSARQRWGRPKAIEEVLNPR